MTIDRMPPPASGKGRVQMVFVGVMSAWLATSIVTVFAFHCMVRKRDHG
jgi:hypothetical protein